VDRHGLPCTYTEGDKTRVGCHARTRRASRGLAGGPQRTLADLQGRQARLVRTLEVRDDPGGTLFEQIARRLGELDREQQTKLAELRTVVAQRPDADAQAVELLELLPLLTPERLAAAPEPLLRAPFERFQLQVRYHKPQNRATVRVALSDDSLDSLLTSLDDIEGGTAQQGLAVSSAGGVSLARGAPRRNRTGDPILTIATGEFVQASSTSWIPRGIAEYPQQEEEQAQ
jgi:hypothetical protein